MMIRLYLKTSVSYDGIAHSVPVRVEWNGPFHSGDLIRLSIGSGVGSAKR